MIYYNLYPKPNHTYLTACVALVNLGIKPCGCPDQSFYVEGELPNEVINQLRKDFTVQVRDSEEDKKRFNTRRLASEYRELRDSEECLDKFHQLIEKHDRDKVKVNAGLADYFQSIGRADLIQFLPQ